MTSPSNNWVSTFINNHPKLVVLIVIFLVFWTILVTSFLCYGFLNGDIEKIGGISFKKNGNKEQVRNDTLERKTPCPPSTETLQGYSIVYVSSGSDAEVRILEKFEKGNTQENTLKFAPQEAALILLSKSEDIVSFNNNLGTWYKVMYFDEIGWIWGGFVKEGKPFTKRKSGNEFVLKDNQVSVYTQPIDDPKLESLLPKLSSPEFVTVESETNDFYYVAYISNSGRGKQAKGYVKKSSLIPK